MIDSFIASKTGIWAESMLKSERARLNSVIHLLTDPVSPEVLWKGMAHFKPYSRITAYIRVVTYYEYVDKTTGSNNANRLREWRKENAHLFRQKYTTRIPQISAEEAARDISAIKDDKVRSAANFILRSGIRSFELARIDNDNNVIGKGGKQRRVYAGRVAESVPYHALYRALKKVGLKPHDLRKIRATDLLRQGMSLVDLQHAFGWSSLKTASVYLAPLQEERIAEMFQK